METVTLCAIVMHDALGKKLAKHWPVTLLTNDRTGDARVLLHEQGDHWGQEFALRIGHHNLQSDILPTGYVLTSTRDEQGELQREVEFDNTAFFLLDDLLCSSDGQRLHTPVGWHFASIDLPSGHLLFDWKRITRFL